MPAFSSPNGVTNERDDEGNWAPGIDGVPDHDEDPRDHPPLAISRERRQVGPNVFWLSYTTADHDRAQDGTSSDLAPHLSARRGAPHCHRLQRGSAEPPSLVSKPSGKPTCDRPTRRADSCDDRAEDGGGREGAVVVARRRRVPSLRGVSTEDRPADTGRSAA